MVTHGEYWVISCTRRTEELIAGDAHTPVEHGAGGGGGEEP